MSDKETKKPHHFSKEARAAKEEKSKVGESAYIPDMQFDSDKMYEFRMTSKVEGTSFVPRTQKVWCETQKKLRDIRYCKTENSPFVDEQEVDAIPERIPMQFTKGVLKVEGSNAAAIKYLLASDQIKGRKKILPQNSAVASKYYLVDAEAISVAKLSREEDILDAKILIRKADEEALENFVRSEFRQSFTTLEDLKNYAYAQAAQHAKKFLKEFNNPLHKYKADMQVLFEKSILTDTKGVVAWADTKGEILTFATSKKDGTVVRADEALANWLLEGTDESKEFKKSYEEKLSEKQAD